MMIHTWTIQSRIFLIRTLLVPLVLAAAPALAQEPAGWGALRLGASRADLARGVLLSAPRAGEPGTAVVDGVSLDGCPAEARVFLRSGRVERLSFSARGAAVARCAGLEGSLRGAYGAPRSERRAADGVTLEWDLPGSLVTFARVHVADPTVHWDAVVLTYEKRD